MNMIESFDWFREDIGTMNGARVGKWVRTKGVALFPTVSRNQREYIERECMLAARTLANVPIDVNHEIDIWLSEKAVWEEKNPGLNYESIRAKPPTWGNVIDAEWDDNTIEYVAQLRGEYGEKMIDRENLTEEEYFDKWKKKPITGVSISASYRYADDDTDMLTPLGLKFNRLSLVEDPESPGVVGTSIELMESYNKQSLKEVEVVGALLKSASPSLFESYRDEVIEPYKEGKPLENKEYVDFPVELNYGELHEVKKLEEETEEATEGEVGEPFAGHKDHAACVAANQDKEDPDAFCGFLKRRAGGETWDDIGEVAETVKEKVDSVIESLKLVNEEEETPEDVEESEEAEEAAHGDPPKKKKKKKKDDEDEDDVEEKHDSDYDEDEDGKKKKKKVKVKESELEIPDKVEPITLESLDFSAFEDSPDLAPKTGDTEADKKITEINDKREKDYEEKRDKSLVKSLRELDEKVVKLAAHQNTVSDTSSDADEVIGSKLSETLKSIKQIQDHLEDKAGVDKVEKLRTAMETVESKLEEQDSKLKESDSDLLSVVDTIKEIANTVKIITSVTDELKNGIDDKDIKIGSLKTALETSESNNGKLATKLAEFETDANTELASLKQTLETSDEASKTLTDKLGELESSSETDLGELKTSLETANENIGKLESTLEDYEELKTKTTTLTEKLETLEKTIEDAKTEEESDLTKLVETLSERLENIEETASPDFKGDKEAEHDKEKSIDASDVFKDIA